MRADTLTSRRRDAIDSLARTIRAPHGMPPGDVAELRRCDPDHPGPTFWKVVARYLDPLLPQDEAKRTREERAWAVVLASLAACKGQHSPGNLGAALSRADLSETRLQALLSADEASLPPQVRAIAHLADSRGEPLDFDALAQLLLHPVHTERGDTVRRQIARQYFAVQHRKEKTS